MNVICDTCKLTLTVRDQDRGRTHSCPVCRGALREESVKPPSTETPVAWPGHDLAEAIALVNGAALSAILDIESPHGKGEIQLIAGGLHQATCQQNGTTLRDDDAVAAMTAWRPSIQIRSRLPSAEGELDQAGPDTGDLADRPLAAVMRYCEDFVLTCAVVAWRGNETAHVYYRRGAIERTLVNGVDDAARLPEVMGWKAGRYRILLPKLELPEAVPEAAPAEASPSTTVPGMSTVPRMETPAAPLLVAEAPPAAPAEQFSPSKLPHRPAMTIIGMPAVVVPPAAAAPQKSASAGTTQPTPAPERPAPAMDAKATQKVATMPAAVAPAPQAPAPAAPAPAAAPRVTQRGAVQMAATPPAAATPTPATPTPATPTPATPTPATPTPARSAPAAAAAPSRPPAVVITPPPATPTPATPTPVAPRASEPRAVAERRAEPPAPAKRSWVVPVLILVFAAIMVAAFFVARALWPVDPVK